MPGRRLAASAAIAVCCAALAAASLADPPGPTLEAGGPPARTAPAPAWPRPPLAAPAIAVPQTTDSAPAADPSPTDPPPAVPQLAAAPSAAPLADPAAPPPGAARACGGLPRFNQATASELMTGQLTIAPFPAVTIDPAQDGDVNWAMNPLGNPTWGQDFRSGGWIEDLVAAYLAGGPEAAAYRQRAKLLAAGWLRALPASGRDPQTLVCIAQAFPGQAWINDQIPPTVDYYAAHWMGAWNHGLMQDIKLLTIGCGYPAGAFGGPWPGGRPRSPS